MTCSQQTPGSTSSRARRAMLALFAALFPCALMFAQAPSSAAPSQLKKEKQTMTQNATGPFDVKLIPQQADPSVADAQIGRMLLDKQFHGDLEATSKGEMLATQTEVKTSAGYVAMERVVGTLKGHKGTFALQHTGTMNRGEYQLSVTVVPDSGTGELTGLRGSMKIIIAEGKHSYDFEYSLPE